MSGAILLLPSPLLPASTYSGLAASLEQGGLDVAVAPAMTDPVPDVAALIRTWAALTSDATILLAHSNAGHLAPAVRDLGCPGARVVFMDAALPQESAATPLAPARFRAHLASLADDAGILPPWTRWWSREELRAVIPQDDFAELDHACPRLPLSYFDTELVPPQGWATAPNAYLAFGTAYAEEIAFAQNHRWPHDVVPGAHLQFLFDPETVARTVISLATRLPSP